MAPTLDVVEGDRNCFYGLLFPNLVEANQKLRRLSPETENKNSHSCIMQDRYFLLARLNRRSNRYGDFLDLRPVGEDTMVAHPKYKLLLGDVYNEG